MRDQRIKAETAVERAAAERRQQRQNAISSGLIGGAFPLLFGQGAGAARGGGIGGAGGGLRGGQFGFGLSLVGTALGNAFDQFAVKSKDLAVSLDTAGDSTQALEALIGRLDEATRERLSNLSSSGQAAEAASLAFEQLAEKLGTQSAAAVIQAGRDFDTLGQIWTQFTSTVGAGIISIIQDALYLNLNVDPKTGKPRFQGPALTKQAQRRVQGSTSDLEIARLATQEAQASLNKNIEGLAIAQKTRAEKEAEVKTQKISNDLEDGSISRQVAFNRILIVEEELNRKNLQIDKQRQNALTRISKEKERSTKREAREAEKAQREADRRAKEILRLNTAVGREKLNQIVIEQNISNVGKSRLEQVKSELAFLPIRESLERALIISSTDDLNLQIEKLRTLELQYDLKQKQLEQSEREIELQEAAIDAVRAASAAAGFDVLGVASRDRGAFAPSGGLLTPSTGPVSFTKGAELAPIIEQEVALARVLEKYQEIGQAAQLTSELVTTGFIDMVSGTRSAEEVFANFLNNLADMLIKTAQQMIAQYIAIGIARMFAMGESASSVAKGIGFNPVASYTGSGPISFAGFPIDGKANGGPVSGGSPYIVGERGPELFVPSNSGTVVPNNALGGNVSIVVNVTEGQTDARGGDGQANQLGKSIAAAVQSELIKQKRPGGLLAR